MSQGKGQISQNNKTVVYSPESPILHPRQLLKTMMVDLRSSFRLAYRLTTRDISSTYRQTALGYFWAIFPPLVTSLTFILLNKANVIKIESISMPYSVFVLTGTVFWQLFVDAMNAPMKVLELNRSMLSKINFPREALIISGIGQVLFSFFIKLLLLAAVLLIIRIQVFWTSVFLPIPMLGLLAIGTLVGIFLLPVGILYRDIQQALTISTTALMFFTPVVFPTPSSGMLAVIIQYNPITPLLVVCREMLFAGQMDNISAALTVIILTMTLILLGWILYRLAMPILIERMDA